MSVVIWSGRGRESSSFFGNGSNLDHDQAIKETHKDPVYSLEMAGLMKRWWRSSRGVSCIIRYAGMVSDNGDHDAEVDRVLNCVVHPVASDIVLGISLVCIYLYRIGRENMAGGQNLSRFAVKQFDDTCSVQHHHHSGGGVGWCIRTSSAWEIIPWMRAKYLENTIKTQKTAESIFSYIDDDKWCKGWWNEESSKGNKD
jgi:hypothetical protein